MERVLEERLREAVCVGDTDAVQELVNLGVDVNARHSVNGWYALDLLRSAFPKDASISCDVQYRNRIINNNSNYL